MRTPDVLLRNEPAPPESHYSGLVVLSQGGATMVVRDGIAAVPIVWDSWGEWRPGLRAPEVVWLRDAEAPRPERSAGWCLVWGNGRIFEMARNGEGPITIGTCPACHGSGAVE